MCCGCGGTSPGRSGDGSGTTVALPYSAHDGQGSGAMHVLIGDDDGQALALMATALEQWGYEVTTACDGTEARSAIEQAKEAPP